MSHDTPKPTNSRPEHGVLETRRLSAKRRGADALEAYSTWLNRVGGGARRRSGVPAALYNLQAYKSWAARIRRDWKETETSEN